MKYGIERSCLRLSCNCGIHRYAKIYGLATFMTRCDNRAMDENEERHNDDDVDVRRHMLTE